MLRVLIAEANPTTRSALRLVLGAQPGVTVTGSLTTARRLVARALVVRPDAAIVGWELPGADVAVAVARLRQELPLLFILVLSDRPETRAAALAAGADAFVEKGEPPEQLLAALRRAPPAYRSAPAIRASTRK
jgi:DNA-binding NarL/FixJ family response regulator